MTSDNGTSRPLPDPATPPARRGPDHRQRRLTAMTWTVLGLVPVLWVVELTGPDWLNLALRAVWVIAAVTTVTVGLADLARRRRGPTAP